MTDRKELIQSYIDQVITPAQLKELQELLKVDPSVRQDLLLYTRLDILIRDYVLFHNYMDEPVHENTETPSVTADRRGQTTEIETLDNLLRRLFPDRNPEAM